MQTSESSSMTAPPMLTPEMLTTQLSQSMSMLKTAVGQTNLRLVYKDKPISMHRAFPSTLPMRWPRVIRQAYAMIWSGKYLRIIIKAPRGGGKSKLLGTVGFDLWYLRGEGVVNMAGSLDQAQIVYGYFQEYCDIDLSVIDYVAGGVRGVKLGETESVAGNRFICVAASPKSVRGKHEKNLLADETCEISDELLDAALPIVSNTAGNNKQKT